MADIRIESGDAGRDRQAAMKELRSAMREKTDCLDEGAHCDTARRAIIDSMRPVMALDPEYFKSFFKRHQEFAAHFNDYKYVEELCVVVCAVEAWSHGPTNGQDSENPYDAVPWIGGLDLHLHASLYFGFSKADMLRCFQIVQEVKSSELDSVTEPNFVCPDFELRDSEDWMLHYTAAVALKFKEAVRALETRRPEFGISDELRADILGSIKSTYWWRYMMLSRAIQPAADSLPSPARERVEQTTTSH